MPPAQPADEFVLLQQKYLAAQEKIAMMEETQHSSFSLEKYSQLEVECNQAKDELQLLQSQLDAAQRTAAQKVQALQSEVDTLQEALTAMSHMQPQPGAASSQSADELRQLRSEWEHAQAQIAALNGQLASLTEQLTVAVAERDEWEERAGAVEQSEAELKAMVDKLNAERRAAQESEQLLRSDLAKTQAILHDAQAGRETLDTEREGAIDRLHCCLLQNAEAEEAAARSRELELALCDLQWLAKTAELQRQVLQTEASLRDLRNSTNTQLMANYAAAHALQEEIESLNTTILKTRESEMDTKQTLEKHKSTLQLREVELDEIRARANAASNEAQALKEKLQIRKRDDAEAEAKFEMENITLKKDLRDASDQIERLKAEAERIRQAAALRDTEHQQKMNDLSSKLLEAQHMEAQHREAARKASEALEGMGKDSAVALEMKSQSDATIQRLEAALAETSQQLQLSSGQQAALQSQLDEAASLRKKADKELETLRGKLKSLSSDLNRVRAERDDAVKMREQTEATLITRIADLESLTKAPKQTGPSSADFDSLQAKYVEAQLRIAEMESLSNASISMVKYGDLDLQLKATMDALTKEREERDRERQLAAGREASLQQQIAALQEAVKRSEEAASGGKTELLTAQRSLQEAVAKADQVTSSPADAMRAAGLAQQVQLLTAEREMLQQLAKERSMEAASLRAKLADLEALGESRSKAVLEDTKADTLTAALQRSGRELTCDTLALEDELTSTQKKLDAERMARQAEASRYEQRISVLQRRFAASRTESVGSMNSIATSAASGDVKARKVAEREVERLRLQMENECVPARTYHALKVENDRLRDRVRRLQMSVDSAANSDPRRAAMSRSVVFQAPDSESTVPAEQYNALQRSVAQLLQERERLNAQLEEAKSSEVVPKERYEALAAAHKKAKEQLAAYAAANVDPADPAVVAEFKSKLLEAQSREMEARRCEVAAREELVSLKEKCEKLRASIVELEYERDQRREEGNTKVATGAAKGSSAPQQGLDSASEHAKQRKDLQVKLAAAQADLKRAIAERNDAVTEKEQTEATLITKCADLDALVRSMKVDLAKQTDETTVLRERCQVLESERNELQAALQKASRATAPPSQTPPPAPPAAAPANEALATELLDAKEKLDAAEAELFSAEVKVADLERLVEELQAEVETLKRERDAVAPTTKTPRKSPGKWVQDTDVVSQEEFARLQQKLIHYQEQIAAMEAQSTGVNRSSPRAPPQEALEKQIAQLQDRLRQSDAEVAKARDLQHQRELSLQSEVDTLQAALQAMTTAATDGPEVAALRTQLEEAQSKLEDAEFRLQIDATDHAAALQELEDKLKAAQHSDGETFTLHERLVQAEAAVALAEKRIAECQATIAQQEAELRRLRDPSTGPAETQSRDTKAQPAPPEQLVVAAPPEKEEAPKRPKRKLRGKLKKSNLLESDDDGTDLKSRKPTEDTLSAESTPATTRLETLPAATPPTEKSSAAEVTALQRDLTALEEQLAAKERELAEATQANTTLAAQVKTLTDQQRRPGNGDAGTSRSTNEDVDALRARLAEVTQRVEESSRELAIQVQCVDECQGEIARLQRIAGEPSAPFVPRAVSQSKVVGRPRSPVPSGTPTSDGGITELQALRKRVEQLTKQNANLEAQLKDQDAKALDMLRVSSQSAADSDRRVREATASLQQRLEKKEVELRRVLDEVKQVKKRLAEYEAFVDSLGYDYPFSPTSVLRRDNSQRPSGPATVGSLRAPNGSLRVVSDKPAFGSVASLKTSPTGKVGSIAEVRPSAAIAENSKPSRSGSLESSAASGNETPHRTDSGLPPPPVSERPVAAEPNELEDDDDVR